ncbi:MAG: hypothetical protein RBS56_03560 [Candidatus Gracilibacteria bacterium]|jgi:predicted negative regulator of RcsB-dependent stress response|nr:hypothetical protein [Candidatus Gracilibacteria bacterium]
MLIKKMRKKKQKKENIKLKLFLRTIPDTIISILLIGAIVFTYNYYKTFKTDNFDKNSTLQTIITIDQKRNEIIKYIKAEPIIKKKAQRI